MSLKIFFLVTNAWSMEELVHKSFFTVKEVKKAVCKL